MPLPVKKRVMRTVSLAVIGILAASASAFTQDRHLTAREVIARIQGHAGVPWQTETVDTFKAGNPNTPALALR
jgi:hypothetical protein